MEVSSRYGKTLVQLIQDQQINTGHLGLMMALLYFSESHDNSNPFPITRKKVMQLSHMKSLPTYYKYMRELVQYGHIQYLPSNHPTKGSLVYLNGIPDQVYAGKGGQAFEKGMI
jgi:hypothetical protein